MSVFFKKSFYFNSMKKFFIILLGLIPIMFLSMCTSVPDQTGAKNDIIPRKINPFADIELNEEPDVFAEFKLDGLKGDLKACKAALDRSDIDYTVVGTQKSKTCVVNDFIALDRSAYPYSVPPRATCPLIAAIVLWENTVIKKAAKKHLKSPIDQIHSVRVFTCRNIAGQKRRSQHSYANAIDITGFSLKNGQKITVLNDWGKRTPAGRFLREVRDESCDIFQMVLSPEYNAAHRDHFHFDMGDWKSCD